MNNWNKRNGQRSTVKRPGTKEYHADFNNKNKQFFQNATKAGCHSCGSTDIKAVGGNGRILVYCARCGKLLKVINTKPTKVGQFSKQRIYRERAGLCQQCGCTHYTGKMHTTTDGKKYVLTLRCKHCGAVITWHNI